MPEAAFVFFAADRLGIPLADIVTLDYNDVIVMLAFHNGQQMARWRNSLEAQ